MVPISQVVHNRLCLALFDPCTLVLQDSLETEQLTLSEQAKREKSLRRKEKVALDRERWAIKFGAAK